MGQDTESGSEITPEKEKSWRQWAQDTIDAAMPEIIDGEDKIRAEERAKELMMMLLHGEKDSVSR